MVIWGLADNTERFGLTLRKRAAEEDFINFQYSRPGTPNITTTGRAGTGVFTYGYDEMNQLVSVSRDGSQIKNYWYDGRGNISDTGSFESGAAKEQYDTTTNELTKDERCIYGYDNEGNTILKDCRYNPYNSNVANANPVKYEYDWNWRNQLVEARVYEGAPGTLSYRVQFGYDGLGRRIWRRKLNFNGVQTASEGYEYNGNNVMYDFDGINMSRKNTYMMNGTDNLLYVTIGNHQYFYHTDHLGSVVAITDEDRDVVNNYNYDAWGNFTLTCPSQAAGKACIPNRYAYTGREWDEDLQMYYYRARWYDPSIQRFTSEDPLLHRNAYVYVLNKPIKYIDSDGFWVKGKGIGGNAGNGVGVTGDLMVVWDDNDNVGVATVLWRRWTLWKYRWRRSYNLLLGRCRYYSRFKRSRNNNRSWCIPRTLRVCGIHTR